MDDGEFTMIENNYIELGKRAVACKSWRWMPGMRWRTEDDRGRLDDFQPEYMGRPPDALPDLTDPATLGCLLALVREAWGPDHILETRQFRTFGEVYVGEGRCFVHPTLAEALVAALEVAP